MKKNIILFFLTSMLANVSTAQVRIQGTVTNYRHAPIYFSYLNEKYNEQRDTVKVDNKGTFYFIKNEEIHSLSLTVGKEKITLFIDSNDQIGLTIDFTKVDDPKVVFSGDHAAENQFQMALSDMYALHNWLSASPYIPFEKYKTMVTQKELIAKQLLDKVTDEKNKTDFAKQLKTAPTKLCFGYYDIARKKDLSKARADVGYASFIKSYDLNNSSKDSYFLIDQVLQWQMDKAGITSVDERQVQYLDFLKKVVTNQTIINDHSTKYLKFLISRQVKNGIQEVFKKYENTCTDTAMVKLTKSRYEVLLNYFSLKKGSAAPDFEMISADGKKIRLSDLRGKMVYIDVWATWCIPCVAEIPHLAALHKKFVNDDRITFISISVDSDVNRWKKKVEIDKSEWEQFIVEKALDSDFYRGYAIETIPRFILVDKTGKIAEVSYMKPSTPGSAEDLKSKLDKS